MDAGMLAEKITQKLFLKTDDTYCKRLEQRDGTGTNEFDKVMSWDYVVKLVRDTINAEG